MPDLTKRDLKRLFLKQQGLIGTTLFGRGKPAVKRAVEQLGWVQIDTISVVERAHHHVLATRIDNYAPDHLDRLLSIDRDVFEYWSHAAAYLPMRDFRFYLGMMEGYRARNPADPKLRREILARVRSDGPVSSRDFEPPKGHKGGGWWEWKPAKLALEQMFLGGELLVTRREGFQKVFDLPDRVLPSEVMTKTPSEDEWFRALALRMINCLGAARARDIGYSRTAVARFTGVALQKPLEAVLAQMVADGEIIRITGLGETWFTTPQLLAQVPARISRNQMHILSPFDNTVINRDRLATLFDFDYQIECYLPAAKRQYGYFSLPILWGDDIIGRMDSKANRAKGLFELKSLHLEPRVAADDRLVATLATAIQTFATRQGCTEFEIARLAPERLRPALVARLGASQ